MRSDCNQTLITHEAQIFLMGAELLVGPVREGKYHGDLSRRSKDAAEVAIEAVEKTDRLVSHSPLVSFLAFESLAHGQIENIVPGKFRGYFRRQRASKFLAQSMKIYAGQLRLSIFALIPLQTS
jgi:hypothetical protein